MIKVIIIEDDQNLASELKGMLESYHSDIKVIGMCYNMQEAEEALDEKKPDLVFMDVELEKGKTSFDMLRKIPNINFGIIFTTGFNNYAIQAIKFSALAYLMKPIDENELNEAIEKFRNENYRVNLNKIENFLSVWSNPGSQQNKMPLPTMTGYDLITVSDIIYCEGVSNQTQFVLRNKKEIIVSMTLKECADLLNPYKFIRIHKSYLANINHIKKYIKKDDGIAIMSNDVNLTVSRSFKDKLIEQLKIL